LTHGNNDIQDGGRVVTPLKIDLVEAFLFLSRCQAFIFVEIWSAILRWVLLWIKSDV